MEQKDAKACVLRTTGGDATAAADGESAEACTLHVCVVAKTDARDLLEAVAKHPGSIIVYCSADAYREISTELLESKGLVLMRKAQVAQNGAFNKHSTKAFRPKIRGPLGPSLHWKMVST